MRKLNDYTPLELKLHISWQYLDLSSNIIRYARCINIRSVGDKLQSLKDVMVKFIDIINNILNDNDSNIEPSRTFSGGLVLFPNSRYNKDDDKYTPLVNKYIDANANNFENICKHFETILKYFQKINNKIYGYYIKEYRNVDYNYPKPKLFYSYAHESKYLRTKVGLSKVEKQFEIINKNVVSFQNQLDNMFKIIKETQKETDNLYHKL
jgi:hypothetical protein